MIPLIAAASIHLCTNQLATQLAAGGFHGKSLQYSWAIVERESHGHPREISATHDYGLFQINRAAYHKQSWWKPHRLLTTKYNIHVAYAVLTEKGHTFWQWGCDRRRQTSCWVYERCRVCEVSRKPGCLPDGMPLAIASRKSCRNRGAAAGSEWSALGSVRPLHHSVNADFHAAARESMPCNSRTSFSCRFDSVSRTFRSSNSVA